jgi:16S rRNA (adenine1518-N6/adenine1519-N6)-dimethyltransferase
VNLHKPSYLRSFLKEKNLSPKKGLSQNFLIDGNIIEKTLQIAGVTRGDTIIEIGPGPGALTEALLAKGANVIAIEKDRSFGADLSRLQTEDNRLTVICDDALNCSIESLLKGRPAKVVANLPYQITTPLLTRLLPLFPHILSVTVMVQKEFAERLMASPKTSAYGSITIFLRFYAKITAQFTVSPNCFYPKPKVYSSVIHCLLHKPPLEADVSDFFTLTRTAFQQRRKMIKTSCRSLYPHIEKALIATHLPATARPEELSLNDFLALYNQLRG